MSGQVHVERHGHVGRIILDQPERRNAVSVEMWAALADAAADLGSDSGIRVVVMRGAGDVAFAAGADISQFGDERADASGNHSYDDATGRAQAALAAMPQPLIAQIHGFCIGAGLALSLSADIRMAAADARFAVPAARLGLGYGYAGIGTLVRLVGPSAAKRIFFLADHLDAAEALRIGLVNRVVPKAELDDAVAEWTDRIAHNAPLTIAAAKAAVRQWSLPDDERDFAEVEKMVRACFESADYREGVDAFLAKRPPEFTGR